LDQDGGTTILPPRPDDETPRGLPRDPEWLAWISAALYRHTAAGIWEEITRRRWPKRRGPKPTPNTVWLKEAGQRLADHCLENGYSDPFELSGEQTAIAIGLTPLSLKRALSERHLHLAHLHATAWKLLGCPPLARDD
jgi:hypothetical protein